VSREAEWRSLGVQGIHHQEIILRGPYDEQPVSCPAPPILDFDDGQTALRQIILDGGRPEDAAVLVVNSGYRFLDIHPDDFSGGGVYPFGSERLIETCRVGVDPQTVGRGSQAGDQAAGAAHPVRRRPQGVIGPLRVVLQVEGNRRHGARLHGDERYALCLDPVGPAVMRTEAGEGRQHHDHDEADEEEPALVTKAARQCFALSLANRQKTSRMVKAACTDSISSDATRHVALPPLLAAIAITGRANMKPSLEPS